MADIADLSERFGDSVLLLALDVTNAEQVKQVVAEAHAHFGKLDVIINNAGYSLVGTVEEAAEADVRALYDANFFGTLRVIQAVLPLLRKQGSGHILGVSSSLAIAAMPLIGFYCSTKWAIEGLHESLAKEVKAFGIKVTMLEPGAYATDFGSPKSLKMAQGMDVYADLRKRVVGGLQNTERGEPQATANAILKVVDAENPPLRFVLGSQTIPMARATYAERLATWGEWEAVSNAAQGTSRKHAPSSS